MFHEYYGQANYERTACCTIPGGLHIRVYIIVMVILDMYTKASLAGECKMVTRIANYLKKSTSLVAEQSEWHIGIERIAQLIPAGRCQVLGARHRADWRFYTWNMRWSQNECKYSEFNDSRFYRY